MPQAHVVTRTTYLRRVVALCFFSFFTVIAGNVCLLKLPQARETLTAFAQPEFFSWPYWSFMAALAYWSFTAWYCARLLLGRRFRFDSVGVCRDPHFARACAKWVPRALGFLACAPLTAYFFSTIPLLFFSTAAYSLLFLGFVIWRPNSPFRRGAAGWGQMEDEAYPKFGHTSQLVRAVLAALFAVSWVLFGLLALGRIDIARAMGSPALLLFALGSWTLFGNMILVYLPKRMTWPSMALLPFLLAFAFSFFNENHLVAQNGRKAPPDLRRPLAEDFAAWKANHGKGPIYLVAAAGGASRSAYFTGMALATLEERANKQGQSFARNVYAMSGVSGGSLGIASFWGAMAAGPQALPKAERFLGQDYLSPLIAFMLFPDALQRFLPFPVRSADRSLGLEKAWEGDWQTSLFADDFLHVTAQWPDLPRLFFNATTVSDGKRVMMSNLDFLPAQANDLLAKNLRTQDMSFAQAVHNSARFTYVSPAALVQAKDGTKWDYVVDGGYFENSGVATLTALIRSLSEQGLAKPKDFVIIVIANEPARASDWVCPAGPPTAIPQPMKPPPFVELSAPPLALYQTRSARAEAAIAEAVHLLGDCGSGRVIELRLPQTGLPHPPPMSWFLNEDSKLGMQAILKGRMPGEAAMHFNAHWARALQCVAAPGACDEVLMRGYNQQLSPITDPP